VSVYWPGNAAKHRAIEFVLRAAATDRLVVFDYGCGTGGDWPRVLADHPGITLVAYDPDSEAAATARSRLAGHAATVTTGAGPPSESVAADVVVSFSVFEHVVDRPAYLATARRHLRPDGTFFLNYDDGHFRNDLRLEAPRTWREPLRALGRHLASPLLARAGRQHAYTVPVPYRELRPLVEAAGFTVHGDRLENLPDFKAAAKLVPDDQRAAFLDLWLATEDALDDQLGSVTDSEGVPVLWSRMLSRTLTLRPV
jgi:SAM-dependent methyltransferase